MDQKKVERVIMLVGGQFTSIVEKALASPKPSVLTRVDAAKTVEDCLAVHESAYRCSLEESLALYRAMSLSTTPEHWARCFCETRKGSPEEALCAHMAYELLPDEK